VRSREVSLTVCLTIFLVIDWVGLQGSICVIGCCEKSEREGRDRITEKLLTVDAIVCLIKKITLGRSLIALLSLEGVENEGTHWLQEGRKEGVLLFSGRKEDSCVSQTEPLLIMESGGVD